MTEQLLDTDVCIDVLRGNGGPTRQRLLSMGAVAVSSITVAELAYGAARSRAPEQNREEIEHFVAAVTVLEFDEQAAWQSGVIRHVLAAAGTPIGGYDLLIAGQALAGDHILVTGNVREFSRVPGLRVEPW